MCNPDRHCILATLASSLIGCSSVMVMNQPTEPTGHLPVVISSSQCDADHNGQMETIEIVLVGGRRYVDTVVGPFMGEKWEGWFRIRVGDGLGHIMSDQSLNDLMRSGDFAATELFFWTPEFQLTFDDYNGDGQADFNLGQYGSSRLFTIRPNGTVLRLNVETPTNTLCVPKTRLPSTDMIGVRDGVVHCRYYNNAHGRYVHQRFKWDGEKLAFVGETVVNGGKAPDP